MVLNEETPIGQYVSHETGYGYSGFRRDPRDIPINPVKKKRRRRQQEEQRQSIAPEVKDRTKFGESVRTQESQQNKFADMLKEAPFEKFSKFDPFITRFVPEDKRADATRLIAGESFNLGSRITGTLERGGMGKEETPYDVEDKKIPFTNQTIVSGFKEGEELYGFQRQARERPIETAETIINVGLPIVSRGLSFVKTPTKVKYGAFAKGDDVISGIGTYQTQGSKFLQPFVKGKTGFGFKQTKAGELTLADDVTLTGARGDTITTISESGEGILGSRTLSVNKKFGKTGDFEVSGQGGFTKTGQGVSEFRSGALQYNEFTAVKGGTSKGVQYEGIIKSIGSKSDDIFGGLRQAKQVSKKRASDLTQDIITTLTPKTKTTPVVSSFSSESKSIVDVSTKPSSSLFDTQKGSQITSGAITTGEKTGQRQRDSLGIGSMFGDRSKGRQRPAQALDTPAISDREKVSDLIKIRPATDMLQKQGTKQKTLQRSLVIEPIIPTTRVPPLFPVGILGRPKPMKKKKGKSVKGKQPRRYTSTSFASAFDIRGKSSQFGIKTGLGLRPLKKKKKR